MGDLNIQYSEEYTVFLTIAKFDIMQLMQEPTANKKSTIDHIYTDLDDTMRYFGVHITHNLNLYGYQFNSKLIK